MRTSTAANLLVQAMNPRRLPVMLGKVWKRMFDAAGTLSQEANLAWIRNNCSDVAALAEHADPALWREARAFEAELQRDANDILSAIEHHLGGGGIYPLLYFLTRLLQPAVVVETGVAAGYSSRAFLAAMDVNGKGRLYSSDFPYFRIANPERYIGVLVPERLKARWTLQVDGDAINLPRIVAAVPSIDIFHYDSDKSYSGRRAAMRAIAPRPHGGSLVIVDDIQDNSFFHDYVTTAAAPRWRIFAFERKYVGIAGPLPF